MRRIILVLFSFLLAVIPVRAEVQVYVEQGDGMALLKYRCTAGEVVRAFALDVSVDQGQIVGISDFFRGESTPAAQGYGIFPSAFRDHIKIGPGTNIDWGVSDYTPVANPADNPTGTLPGLGSSGVTLEFGALWDPSEPAAIPAPEGTLCALRISQSANVSVRASESRGGVVAANPDMYLAPVFSGAYVHPPEITGFSVSNKVLIVTFSGGELETAPAVAGPWSETGNDSGRYVGSAGDSASRFYRVRSP